MAPKSHQMSEFLLFIILSVSFYGWGSIISTDLERKTLVFSICSVLVTLCQFDRKIKTQGSLTWGILSIRLSYSVSGTLYSLMIDRWGINPLWAYLTVWVVWGCTRKQAMQTIGTKSVTLPGLCFTYFLRLLPWLPSGWNREWKI